MWAFTKNDTHSLSSSSLTSISIVYTLGGDAAYLPRHWAVGMVHPGQVVSPSQGNTELHMRGNHACIHTPRGNLERPNNITVIVLDYGRKPEHPENMQTPCRKTLSLNQGPSYCKTTMLPTVPLCSKRQERNWYDRFPSQDSLVVQYLSEDEARGCGASIRPLEPASPGISPSVYLDEKTKL